MRQAWPGKAASERALEIAVEARHQIEDAGLEVVEAVPHLVEDAGAAGADVVALPQRDHLLLDEAGDLLALLGQEIVGVEPLHGGGDAAEALQRGAAPGLRGVGGEDGDDLGGVEPALHLLRGGAAQDDLGDAGGDGLGAGHARPPARPIAQHPAALELLRQVDEGKVGAEGAQQIARVGDGGARDDGVQRRRRPGPAAGAHLLGEGAHLLLEREHGLARLLADDAAEQVAEEMDGGREPIAAGGLLCGGAQALGHRAWGADGSTPRPPPGDRMGATCDPSRRCRRGWSPAGAPRR